MHDLDLVIVANDGLRPIDTTNDGVVQLDGDALFWQRKKLQQFVEIDLCGNFPFLAVYRYRDHGSILDVLESEPKSTRHDDTAKLDFLTFGDSTDKQRGSAGIEFW